MGFEPMTSALPRMRSTTELQRPEIYPDYCPACCPDIPAALPGPVHRKAMTAPQANPAWEGLFPLRPHRSTTPSRNPPNYPPPTTPLHFRNLPLGLSLLLPPQRSRRAVQGFGTKPTPFIPHGTTPGCTLVPPATHTRCTTHPRACNQGEVLDGVVAGVPLDESPAGAGPLLTWGSGLTNPPLRTHPHSNNPAMHPAERLVTIFLSFIPALYEICT